MIARPFAAALAVALDAQVVVDNRPGLGATAAPAFVASAPADGRTLLMNTSAHAYTAALSEGLPYDPIADFVPVAAVTSQAYVLVASPNTGLRSSGRSGARWAVASWRPVVCSMGVGTGSHVCAAQLNRDLGIDARHFPARAEDGISETIARVAAGEADYVVSPISIAAPLLAGGALVPIGVTAARRSPLLPDVPTLVEVGAEGFDFPIWYGLWAPVETPAPVVAELAAAVSEALRSPELASRFEEHGAEILRLTQTEFADFVTSEVARARRFA